MRTQDLIAALAADTPPRGPALGKGLAWAGLGGLVTACLVMQALLGIRSSFVASLVDPRFLFKFLVTGTLAAVMFRSVLALARPQTAAPGLPAVIWAPSALLACGVAAELFLLPSTLWMPRLVGSNALQCLTYVPLISLVPLALVLLALRRGAAASPAAAGLVAGLASGAMGAFFYAAHCPDDSPLFVAVWYTLGIGIMGLTGAVLGSRALRW